MVPKLSHMISTGSQVVSTDNHVIPKGSQMIPRGSRVIPTGSHVVPTGSHVAHIGYYVVLTKSHGSYNRLSGSNRQGAMVSTEGYDNPRGYYFTYDWLQKFIVETFMNKNT